MSSSNQFSCIGVVGAGNMGSMMAFAFSELGLDVSVWDARPENVDALVKQAQQVRHGSRANGKIRGFRNAEDFTASLETENQPKLFIFSITHGHPADSVLAKIKPNLKNGDIILDGGNEHYRNTERRQSECAEIGVHWVGTGVSGGYQSARHGPSMSPGGNADVLEQVMPLLELYSAKDPKSGAPCVAKIGPGGSGHYVKMVHNGIEVGMMSALCEAWSLLKTGLGFSNDQIGDVLARWNSEGELSRNFLVRIGSDICKTRKPATDDGQRESADEKLGYILDDVLDKVVQDDDGSEGTPTWSIMESAFRHVSCPTLAAGLYFRMASGDRAERLKVAQRLSGGTPQPIMPSEQSDMTEKIRRAVYCAFLASFCQGLELISHASADEGWDIELNECIRIWRAGCIIQSEYIADIFESAFKKDKTYKSMTGIPQVAQELQHSLGSLREVVLLATQLDHPVPALSATLEYIKYVSGTALPTQFMEAEMDYFGAHSYDKPGVAGEDPGRAAKGHHHYEWQPA